MMSEKLSRRSFIKSMALTIAGIFGFVYFSKLFGNKTKAISKSARKINYPEKEGTPTMGGKSLIYEAKNGTPEQNMAKVIEMMGGIGKIIDKNDIVILKPNAQWWNQGMTNTNAMKGFIELVLGVSGFAGEIIIAENHHCYGSRYSPNIRGWNTQNRNGDFNYNELVAYFNRKGFRNVTKYHWVDAGPFSGDESLKSKLMRPVKEVVKKILNIQRGKLVSGPEEGDGYVWTEIDYHYNGKKTRMTYPVFTSEYSKTTIDFKKGAWKNGKYTGQPVKFINFAGLNHHSSFAGATSAVKNYLGVVDLTCGYKGARPRGYHNFHYIGIPGMGGAVGTFMKTIRRADLNIVTADWTGFGSRTDTSLAARTRTIIAGTDPVALDYYGTKYVLYPLGGPVANLNNPDDKKGPLRKYLELCCTQGIGTLDEQKMEILKYKFDT